MPIAADRKQEVISQFRRAEPDSGSPEVQIALLTERIQGVSDHLKGHDQDHHSRRGLIMMVGKRNRLLRYLARRDPAKYTQVIGRLGLRK